MRLSAEEATAIRTAAQTVFGADAVVRLFGSRVDDARRGGDIDLLIEMDAPSPDYLAHSKFLDRIEQATDAKKVDLLFHQRGRPLSAFQWIARRDGVAL